MIGRTLAHYEITGLLGKGGMGEVYRARDTKLDRDVALKILPADMAADSSRLERFDREAKTVAGLNHPNIVHMYSVEEDAGIRFLTMELVEGRELGERLSPEGLPLSELLEIGLAVAEALAEAHEKGVIHRDLKPANVMLTPDGRVKVLDFGLAKLAERDAPAGEDLTRAMDLTHQGAAVGTVPYMSPEQLRGQEVDARTDLFSLGVILHELATGQRPFAGPTPADVTSSILREDPPELRARRSDLPPRLHQLLSRCLEKEREHRPASAREVADALRELRRELESGSGLRPVTVPSVRTGSSLGRRRPLLLLTAALLALLAAAILLWPPRERDSAPTEASSRPIVAVLPFENLGGEEDAYFAAGITDEITSRLALIQGLGVISRTSARVYEGSDKSIPEVGRELGTDYVLEGAIRWDKSHDPERVRITPRLIRVEDDTNLWSDNYEREVTEIFALQAAIASRIAEALDIALVAPVREALDHRPTESIEAYQAYLQGMRQLYAPGFGREGFELGIQMFERAAQLDPGFALALARLSSLHSRMYHYGYDRSEERLRQARETADRALALRPDLAEARLAMAHYYYWGIRDYERALGELEIALSREPDNSDLWLTTAYVKRRQGDFEAALDLLKRNQALSPLDPNVAVGLGETYGTLRRYAEGEEAFRRGIALAPDDPYPYTELTLLYLRWRGDVGAAREVLQAMPRVGGGESRRVGFLVELLDRQYDRALAVLREHPDPAFEAGSFFLPTALFEGMVHRLAQNPERARSAFESAREALEEKLARDPRDARIHSALGLSYAGLGRSEDAIRHGRRAVELHPLRQDALQAPVQRVHLALIQTMLGNHEGALEELEAVLSIPSTFSVAWLQADPRWDVLREYPGYAILLEKHGAIRAD